MKILVRLDILPHEAQINFESENTDTVTKKITLGIKHKSAGGGIDSKDQRPILVVMVV